jgi:hypothetical protein
MVTEARSCILPLTLCLGVLVGAMPNAWAEVAPPPSADIDAERAAPSGDQPRMAALRPMSRSGEFPEPNQRCTADRASCISLASYIPDVCRTIEAAARKNTLDPHFFARLLWKESLFDAGAISPVGALGIAQFMPETAKLRGLVDPFNPAEALYASAEYLSELSRSFGNIGLAAVAYNGGEARAERFVTQQGSLPTETREYVQAITGHSAESWRDAPPEALDLSLGAGRPFQSACVAQAANRNLREFRSTPMVLPWGVIIASNQDRGGAERQVRRLQNRHADLLRGELVAYTRDRVAGVGRLLYVAQVGRNNRAEADSLCDRLRSVGGACMVLRNGT